MTESNSPTAAQTRLEHMPVSMFAITIATLVMLEKIGGTFFSVLAIFLLTALVLLVVTLITKTVRAVMRGEICVPE